MLRISGKVFLILCAGFDLIVLINIPTIGFCSVHHPNVVKLKQNKFIVI